MLCGRQDTISTNRYIVSLARSFTAMNMIPSKSKLPEDAGKMVAAWYGVRAKTGPAAPMKPLKSYAEINAVLDVVKDSARDKALFLVGINTAYRASDYLGWKIRDVRGLVAGQSIDRKEKKTRKYRMVSLNGVAIKAIDQLLALRPEAMDDDYLFVGTDGKSPITVGWYGQLVKKWCMAAGLKGTYGSHSLRKTWGYMQRTVFKMPLDKIQQAYCHSSGSITLAYVCIQDEEMHEMYMNELGGDSDE